MYTLYHHPLCPFSRKVRTVLKEKGMDFSLAEEQFWERRKELALLNPAMQVPVLKLSPHYTLSDSQVICEYLEEKHPSSSLLGTNIEHRAEIRRVINWFDQKFFREVGYYLLQEKVIRYYQHGTPSSSAIRAAKNNLTYHMEYIAFLTKNHQWLTGETYTLADITAAAHISIVDYLGEIAWQHFPQAKEWYALIKSRPSFRPLLSDYIKGFSPPPYYTDPDF